MTIEKKYLGIVKHYEACLDEHGDTHKGVDWPNSDDASLRYSVMLELIKEDATKVTLLDFGCGAAHLLQYILDQKETFKNIDYSGSDISEKFIELSKKKFPKNNFYCFDLLEDDVTSLPKFDYAILNGVFTEKQDLSFDDMWIFFTEMIVEIFKKVNTGIAFNVMSKAVDWERDDLFHLPTDMLIDFLTKEVTRNFVIRNDYGLYEYTVYLYK